MLIIGIGCIFAGSVGMADEQDSGSCVDYPRVGSSPIFRINNVLRKSVKGLFSYHRDGKY